MTDRYRQRLARAKWTWRAARAADRRETEAEAQDAVMDAPDDRFPCDCGDPDCARAAYLASIPAR